MHKVEGNGSQALPTLRPVHHSFENTGSTLGCLIKQDGPTFVACRQRFTKQFTSFEDVFGFDGADKCVLKRRHLCLVEFNRSIKFQQECVLGVFNYGYDCLSASTLWVSTFIFALRLILEPASRDCVNIKPDVLLVSAAAQPQIGPRKLSLRPIA